MAIKVAFIGAGSLGFTRGLMRDILTVPEFAETVFAFTDINERNLDMIAQLGRKDIRENKLGAVIEATTDRRKALEGANYVISCVRVGGLEGFETDIDIPLKYGVDQCVGDTLCAGGIMYGQRNVAAILDFCADIREVSRPGALFLNYANPNAMNTWAANHYGKVNTIGLCHGVMGGHHQIAEVIQLMVNGRRKKPGDAGFKAVTTKDVDIVCAGINHQTWYIKAIYEGEDWSGRLLEGFEKHPVYSQTEYVRIDMIRRFGYFSTESNGHLSEYLPWYRKRLPDIRNWISLSSWIHGETAGYLRVCLEGRKWFETDFPRWMTEPSSPIRHENRGHEHGSYIIEGLETGRVYRGHFNVVNNGAISNLPDDAIVELPGYVDRNGVSIPRIGPLPLGCAAVCNVSISVQRLAVEAAVRGDVTLLKQAMLLDPLNGAVCDPIEIDQMTDEMLVAQAQWLPQYAHAMAAARRRLTRAKSYGEYRGTCAWEGNRNYLLWMQDWARHVLTKVAISNLQPGEEMDIRKVECPPASQCREDIEGLVRVMQDGFVKLRDVHDGEPGVVYLLFSHQTSKACAGELIYGADGPVKVWVNGKEADCRPDATTPARPGQFKTQVKWKRGVNRIQFALNTNGGKASGVYCGVG